MQNSAQSLESKFFPVFSRQISLDRLALNPVLTPRTLGMGWEYTRDRTPGTLGPRALDLDSDTQMYVLTHTMGGLHVVGSRLN